MKKRSAYLIGWLFLFEALVALLMIFCPEGFTVTVGVVLVCVGLAGGLLLNPASVYCLLAGGGILMLPKNFTGWILLLLAVAAMVCNLIQAKER